MDKLGRFHIKKINIPDLCADKIRLSKTIEKVDRIYRSTNKILAFSLDSNDFDKNVMEIIVTIETQVNISCLHLEVSDNTVTTITDLS